MKRVILVRVIISILVAGAIGLAAFALQEPQAAAAERHPTGLLLPLGWQEMGYWDGDHAIYSTTALPARWDWREFITPTTARNQGRCGSCVAFATTAVTEAIQSALHPPALDLAEQTLVSCSNGAVTCAGGYINRALDFVRTKGLPLERDNPYVGKDVACRAARSVARLTRWAYVGSPNRSPTVDELKRALDHGPIVVGVNGSGAFQNYRGGIFTACGAAANNHAIKLEGYKDDRTVQGGGYWIVKNSWGPGWGEQGYMRIAYKGANGRACNGIGAVAAYAVVDNIENLREHLGH